MEKKDSMDRLVHLGFGAVPIENVYLGGRGDSLDVQSHLMKMTHYVIDI
jgi:hypothetical protein